MLRDIPLASVILLVVAAILGLFYLLDQRRADGGNQLKRKIWLRTALILFVVSVAVSLINLA